MRVHSRQDALHKEVCRKAVRDKSILCPWCERRPPNGKWAADHLTPRLRGSPLLSACGTCNSGRKGEAPKPEAIQRILYSPRVFVYPSQERARKWLESHSLRLFGSLDFADLLIAATWGCPIYRLNLKGERRVDVRATSLCVEVGLIKGLKWERRGE